MRTSQIATVRSISRIRSSKGLLAALALAPLALVTLAPAAGATSNPGPTVSPYGAVQDVAPDSEPAAKVTGSIVYLKNNNIWLIRGDGTGDKQITQDGSATSPYRVPSQADDGTIAAARGDLIIRMSHSGQILNTINPPALKNSLQHPMDGAPTEVAISPDGKLIAWSFGQFECPVGSECGMRVATGYTAADHLTWPNDYGTTFYDSPSWVGNDRTLQTFASQVEIHDLGSTSKHWFTDSMWAADGTDLSDVELSDDGKWLAVVRGFGANTYILWASVKGDATSGPPPGVPHAKCSTNLSDGVGSPTWAPNTAAIAYTYPQGIYVFTNPTKCGGSHAPPELIAKGGTHPDWSPAKL